MNNRKDFKVNDLLYAVVIGYGGINKYHQFARVENVSNTGKFKLSLFPSLKEGEDIVRDGVRYIPVKPNINAIRQIKLVNANGYQSDLECTYSKYNDNMTLYDTIEE